MHLVSLLISWVQRDSSLNKSDLSTIDTVTQAVAEIFIRKKYLIHTQLSVE